MKKVINSRIFKNKPEPFKFLIKKRLKEMHIEELNDLLHYKDYYVYMEK